MTRRVPLRSVLRGEWAALRTSPAAWAGLLGYAAVVVLGGWTSLSGTAAPEEVGPAVAAALVGFVPGLLVLLALGAGAVTAEYRTGTVLTTLTAVPRRTRWLVARTLVVCAVVALVTAALAVGCVAAVPALTAGTLDLPLDDPAVLVPVALQVAAAVLVTVLGLGLGALTRRGPVAVALGVVLSVVAPVVTVAVLDGTAERLARWWPTLRIGVDDLLTVATRGSFGVPAGGDALLAGATPWTTGTAVLGGWALAAWVAGMALVERRDV